MDLLALSIVLLLLLAASYSGRGAWVALGSIALTVVLVTGSVFLVTAQRAGPFLEALSAQLPSGWAQRTEDLAAAAGFAATALTSSRTGPGPAPTSVASLSEGLRAQREPLRPSARPGPAGSDPLGQTREPPVHPSKQPAVPPEPQPVSGGNGAPVKWILDAPIPSPALLVGTNVSDAPLEQIRATLRPDGNDSGVGADTLPLLVIVDGQGSAGERRNAATAVPPGARFTLERPASAAADTPELGGAVLSFAYVQAGRRRTSIIYLAPKSLADAASRNGTSAERTSADGPPIQPRGSAPRPAPSSGVR